MFSFGNYCHTDASNRPCCFLTITIAWSSYVVVGLSWLSATLFPIQVECSRHYPGRSISEKMLHAESEERRFILHEPDLVIRYCLHCLIMHVPELVREAVWSMHTLSKESDPSTLNTNGSRRCGKRMITLFILPNGAFGDSPSMSSCCRQQDCMQGDIIF